jgi:hypothetical protein
MVPLGSDFSLPVEQSPNLFRALPVPACPIQPSIESVSKRVTIQGRATLQKEFYECRVASVGGQRQSSIHTVGPSIQFSAIFNKQRTDACIPFERSNHQQSPGLPIREIRAESYLQLLSQVNDVALPDEFAGIVESHL